MANELIRPIDADTARAIEEASKALTKAFDAAIRSGAYATDVMADLPRDLVGMIGDWVKHKRLRRWVELQDETEKILRKRGIQNRQDVSPSVAVPLIDAAINEDREGLKQLWAQLLATAMDPTRSNEVRPSIVDLLKKIDPLDAQVLVELVTGRTGPESYASTIEALETKLGQTRDDIWYSFDHLYELGAVEEPPRGDVSARLRVAAKARLLMRAVSE